MVDYCTEAELTAYTVEDYDANSTPTTTQIGTLITRASRMVDSAGRVSDDNYTTSPPGYVKQATIETSSMLIDNFREKDIAKRHSTQMIRDNIVNWLDKAFVWSYSLTTSRNENEDYLGPARQ